MDMIGWNRQSHSRKKKSARAIGRITGLSRKTISKWLHGEVDGPPKHRRGEQPSKLMALHDVLRQAIEDKHLNTVVGVAVRINQRTASIDPGDGTT